MELPIDTKIKRAQRDREEGMTDSTKLVLYAKLEQLSIIRDYMLANHINSEGQAIRELIEHGQKWAQATGILPQ